MPIEGIPQLKLRGLGPLREEGGAESSTDSDEEVAPQRAAHAQQSPRRGSQRSSPTKGDSLEHESGDETFFGRERTRGVGAPLPAALANHTLDERARALGSQLSALRGQLEQAQAKARTRQSWLQLLGVQMRCPQGHPLEDLQPQQSPRTSAKFQCCGVCGTHTAAGGTKVQMQCEVCGTGLCAECVDAAEQRAVSAAKQERLRLTAVCTTVGPLN
jgi:hypothetical protein